MPASPQLLRVINQLFEAEKKASRGAEFASIQKNLERMHVAIEEMGLLILNPQGEEYHESRTDCECSIAGDPGKKLFIKEVLKPVIYGQIGEHRYLVQKAVVIADN